MSVHSPVINTQQLPSTTEILNQFLPNIYQHKCINDQNLPFSEEVLKTEVGHLFEHILLEYLTQLAETKGLVNIIFKGETNWNWQLDTYGTFRINIHSDYSFGDSLKEAISKATELMQMILSQPVISPLKLSQPQAKFEPNHTGRFAPR